VKEMDSKRIEVPRPKTSHEPAAKNPRDGLASRASDTHRAHESDAIRKTAEGIANGHAWRRHAHEFPHIKDQKQFAGHIENVMRRPSETKKLENDRKAYWHDPSKTFVVEGKKIRDGGTCFRPPDQKAYFDKLKSV
jgi:pyocin large subunit-like protein